jgi:hypothetical protein
MNPLVEAAWIAGGATLIGVGGTVIVGVSAFRSTSAATRATIEAAREQRVWDLKAEAYAQALTEAVYRADHRDLLRGDDTLADDALYEAAVAKAFTGLTKLAWNELEGRLLAFGSHAVTECYEEAIAATMGHTCDSMPGGRRQPQISTNRAQ